MKRGMRVNLATAVRVRTRSARVFMRARGVMCANEREECTRTVTRSNGDARARRCARWCAQWRCWLCRHAMREIRAGDTSNKPTC